MAQSSWGFGPALYEQRRVVTLWWRAASPPCGTTLADWHHPPLGPFLVCSKAQLALSLGQTGLNVKLLAGRRLFDRD
jgi:hypothetical protein